LISGVRVTSKLVLALAIALLLSNCAAQSAGLDAPPDFWWGLVHGLTAPFALVAHLFSSDVRIYAVPNSGGWYDFGFLLGNAILVGSASLPAYW
jgi:hypothetical protein